jgi:hypothetical protein
MTQYEYHEKVLLKLLPFILTQAVLGLGIISPFVREFESIRWLLAFLILAIVFFEIRVVLDKRPVLVITDEGIVLKGLKPGFYKPLQFWYQETIPTGDIISIKVGKIREDIGFGVKLPPLNTPSSTVTSQKFLWVKYCKAGKEAELYYPHISAIKNFGDALTRLQRLAGNKLVVFSKN